VDGLNPTSQPWAIVRSAKRLGAHGWCLPQRRRCRPDRLGGKVPAGASANLPVAKVINLTARVEQLKDEGYRVVGLAEEGTVKAP